MGHSASEQLQYGTLVTPLELACRIPQTELPKHGVSFWKKFEIITIFLSKQSSTIETLLLSQTNQPESNF